MFPSASLQYQGVLISERDATLKPRCACEILGAAIICLGPIDRKVTWTRSWVGNKRLTPWARKHHHKIIGVATVQGTFLPIATTGFAGGTVLLGRAALVPLYYPIHRATTLVFVVHLIRPAAPVDRRARLCVGATLGGAYLVVADLIERAAQPRPNTLLSRRIATRIRGNGIRRAAAVCLSLRATEVRDRVAALSAWLTTRLMEGGPTSNKPTRRLAHAATKA